MESKKGLLKKFPKASLSEEAARFYETIFKSFGILGAIIAFFWGVYEFKIGKEREYGREIFLEQVKIMNEVVDITSTLATFPEEDSKFKEASIQLDKLRAGRLYLFSDNKLDDLMGNFFADFNSFTSTPPGVDKNTLERESVEISNYCRQKIVELTKLTHE